MTDLSIKIGPRRQGRLDAKKAGFGNEKNISNSGLRCSAEGAKVGRNFTPGRKAETIGCQFLSLRHPTRFGSFMREARWSLGTADRIRGGSARQAGLVEFGDLAFARARVEGQDVVRVDAVGDDCA